MDKMNEYIDTSFTGKKVIYMIEKMRKIIM